MRKSLKTNEGKTKKASTLGGLEKCGAKNLFFELRVFVLELINTTSSIQ